VRTVNRLDAAELLLTERCGEEYARLSDSERAELRLLPDPEPVPLPVPEPDPANGAAPNDGQGQVGELAAPPAGAPAAAPKAARKAGAAAERRATVGEMRTLPGFED
jgi:hypothetical protein